MYPIMQNNNEKDLTLTLARLATANMAVFDTVLGLTSLLKPDLLERLLGLKGDKGGRAMLQRTSFVWLAYALAHSVALARGSSADWQVLAWMRAMEVPADPVWALKNKKRLEPRGRFQLMVFTPAWNTFFTFLFSSAARKTRAQEFAR